jgi:exosome complex component RRP4
MVLLMMGRRFDDRGRGRFGDRKFEGDRGGRGGGFGGRRSYEESSEQAEGVGAEYAEVQDFPSREIVVPGEMIGERGGRKLGEGVYEEGDKIFSKKVGIPFVKENEVKVIPMTGVYIPSINDKVIAVITKVEISGWAVDLNSPYTAFLPVSEGVDEFVDVNRMDISKFFDIGEVIFCKISKVTKNKTIRVSMRALGSRKLTGGVTIKIPPTKIPRIIGKGGSMINMIKTRTGCLIYVGKNGLVWVKGDHKAEAIEAILTIVKESHTSGLTDKIDRMLASLPQPPAQPAGQAPMQPTGEGMGDAPQMESSERNSEFN